LLVVQLIPPGLMAQFRATAAAAVDRPVSKGAAIVVIGLWLAITALVGWWLYRGGAGWL
jgi:hypothetical protein